jgi:pimeloyl-ACP methyl ester carboxylesterase
LVDERNGNYVKVNGLKMYYEDVGDGPPLVLIHGGISTARHNWGSMIPHLVPHFRVIAPDSRGHGKTDNPSGEFSYKLMGDDTVALIRELKLEKPIICGWSDGGQIALEIGINYPGLAKALIAGGVLSELSDQYRDFMKALGIYGPGDVDFNKLQEAYSEFVDALVDAHSSVYGPDYFVDVLYVNISKMWTNPEEFPGDKLTKIVDPTSVIHGDRDEAIPLEDPVRIYRMIPNAELTVMPNANHGVALSQPEKFAKVIIDYAQRIESGTE